MNSTKSQRSGYCLVSGMALSALCVILQPVSGGEITWKKHLITQQGHCNTAVALDVNGDKLLDVIASFNGRVSLFLAPDWKSESVLHRFSQGGSCIHSEVIDADGDGDLDWAGTLAHDHPFWLENPGNVEAAQGAWAARIIDPEITGIHCITRSDIDNDGNPDLVINNFEPARGIGDSMAWFSIPQNPHKAKKWNRHIFADKDARGGSHYMGVGDVNGDGWNDIAVGAKGRPFADGNWFAFWTHPGSKSASGGWKKTVLATNQIGATNILPADINGDGKTDWFASRGHGLGILWFENPSWKMHEVDTEIQFPHSLTVADFDNDGDMDGATCGFGSERVMWYENDGSGKFKLHTIDTGQQSYDLRAIDMDGDGDLDLLNAGRGTRNVVWYENI